MRIRTSVGCQGLGRGVGVGVREERSTIKVSRTMAFMVEAGLFRSYMVEVGAGWRWWKVSSLVERREIDGGAAEVGKRHVISIPDTLFLRISRWLVEAPPIYRKPGI